MTQLSFLNPHRLIYARHVLLLLLALGPVAGISDYLNGNLIALTTDLGIAACALACLLYSSRSPFSPLPQLFCLAILVLMYLWGAFILVPHELEKLAWIGIYPFAFFYLSGLELGILLSSLAIILLPAGYLLHPVLFDKPQISLYGLSQVTGVTVLSTLLAYQYEKIRARYEQRLLHRSEHDPLTGLLNRRGFSAQSTTVIQHVLRSQKSFAVVLLDVDDFKRVNDTKGHDAGDRLLEEIASLLQRHTRGTDLIARWGGEEFILLLAHSDMAGARTVTEKICSAISSYCFTTGKHTASFGLAFHEWEEPLEATIHRADHAMYQAKRSGKNRVEVLLHPA